MQLIAVLAVAVRLRRAGTAHLTNPTLGSANPDVADLAASPLVEDNSRGPPDLEMSLEVVSPDQGFVAQALDNWTATVEHLKAGFAAATGANATRFEITSEMDTEDDPAVLQPVGFSAPLTPGFLQPITPTVAPVVPCTFNEYAPPECYSCRDCLKGWCKGNACAGCEPCAKCEPYFSCVEPTVAARLQDAEHELLEHNRGSHHAAVSQPMLYFFNVTIAPDPNTLCPHSADAGLSYPVGDPRRCPCIEVLRAANVSALLLSAMKLGHVADFALDGRPAGSWMGLGGKRFMKPQPPPNHTDTFLHWEGGAPVTPDEAMELSAATSNLVSDFVAEQAQHSSAAAEAMQGAAELPCTGTVHAPKGPDGAWHPYPCVERNQETPEVPTQMAVPKNPEVGPGAAIKQKHVVT